MLYPNTVILESRISHYIIAMSTQVNLYGFTVIIDHVTDTLSSVQKVILKALWF